MKRKKKPPKKVRPKMVRVALQGVEIRAGHDGLLRGKPEPVILLAAYCMTTAVAAESTTTFVGETMARLHPRKPFPTQIALAEEVVISVDMRQISAAPEPDRLLVLALALEEDSSDDVQRLYKRLATPQSLFLWDCASVIPAPVTLANAARWLAREAADTFSVHVMDGVADVGEQCSGDNFVAAQAVVVELSKGPVECRLRFVSADRRNDWTAQLLIKC